MTTPTEELINVRVDLIGDYYSMSVMVDVPRPKDEDDEEWKEVALKTAIDLIVSHYGWTYLESTLIDADFDYLPVSDPPSIF